MNVDELKKLIRDIPDFPKPGILFRDITPLIGNARGLAAIVDQMAEAYLGKVDAVLGIESRGFIFGAPVAYRLGVGPRDRAQARQAALQLRRGIIRTGVRPCRVADA